MRILIVEDEENIGKLLKMNLEIEGHEVIWETDGNQAFETYQSERFDLLILDIMLPGQSGIHLCRKIRLHNTEVPIMFLSAKSTAEERIKGLKIGADDYLTKPFELEELLLRVERLLQRSYTDKKSELEVIEFGKNKVNFIEYQAEKNGELFSLTQKEVLLLKLLYEKKNEVVSRKEILQAVWGYDVLPSTRTIDNFILMLRKHFEEDPKKPKIFKSVRGVGYKMIVP